MENSGKSPRLAGMKRFALVSLRFLGSLVVILLLLEVALQIIFRVRSTDWYFLRELSAYTVLFEHHPILVGSGRPFATFTTAHGVTYTHNSMGFRSPETSPARMPGIRRVLVMGGSSTYCVGVSDSATWPVYLGQLMGKEYEIINMSVPGYCTEEHVIQTALLASDLSPDVCLYYVGWNDVREMHVRSLRPDYSNFHSLAQYNNLKIFSLKTLNRSLVATFLVRLVNKVFLDVNFGLYEIEGTTTMLTAQNDPRALGLFERNVRQIIASCKTQKILPIMIPQVLNYGILVGDKPSEWVPYVRERDLKAAMGYYIEALRRICAEQNVPFIDDVLREDFEPSYFLDDGHFNAKGNLKFAEIVARRLRDAGPSPHTSSSRPEE